MATGLISIGILIALAALYILLRTAGAAYLRFRGTRVVICPESSLHEAVEVDAWKAAEEALHGVFELRLQFCSRWPERQDCAQSCLKQVASAPEDCLARNLIAAWYAGKRCAVCGKSFDRIGWMERQPALVSPAHQHVGWEEVAPRDIPAVLATHSPLCSNCHLVSRFAGRHPSLIPDRSRRV